MDPADVGRQVHAIVAQEAIKKMLEERHFIGTLRRHSREVDDSINSLKDAQQLHSSHETAVLAIVDQPGNVVGLATAYPDLELKRQRVPFLRRLPPDRVRWPVVKRVKYLAPNIAAWTSEPLEARHVPSLLEKAYTELASAHSEAPAFRAFTAGAYDQLGPDEKLTADRSFNPWTIETGFTNSPVHMAVVNAGLHRQAGGWFDDNEDTHQGLPFSSLYTLKRHLRASA